MLFNFQTLVCLQCSSAVQFVGMLDPEHADSNLLGLEPVSMVSQLEHFSGSGTIDDRHLEQEYEYELESVDEGTNHLEYVTGIDLPNDSMLETKYADTNDNIVVGGIVYADCDVVDSIACGPQTSQHGVNNDREYRMCRRRRLSLRKRMLSFEPPPKATVFRRIRFVEDFSDQEELDDQGDDPTMHAIPLTAASNPKTSRKKKRDERKWKRNVIKEARETGKSYTNYTGEQIAQKEPKIAVTLCRQKCRFKCSEKINDASRQVIFSTFYSLPVTAQDVYIFGCVTSHAPKLSLIEATQHREVSVEYTVNVDNDSVRVCKVAFQNLHSISSSKVRHIVEQSKKCQTTALCSLRGKHDTRPNKIPEEQREIVRTHIKSFPAQESHYSRSKNTNRMYLSPTLTINSMYKEYANQCQVDNRRAVSGSMYRYIFNDFNLGFGSPRSDTCSRCETLTQSDELKLHKLKAEAAFEQQRLDRADARTGQSVYITFDMEKTLPLPKLSVGEAFYLRQLWLYNTGIHLVHKKRQHAYFQIWTEDQGHRGVNEIGSSLLTFFDVAKVGGPDQKLIAWSDSCSGQNKNFGIISFWQYLILTKRFKSVEHKFPEPGHTYLDSDRDFGKVETAVKRREHIYTVDEYQEIMANSQAKVTVTRVGDKMIDVMNLPEVLNLTKQTMDDTGAKIQLRDKVRWIKVTEFGKYEYRHSLSDEEPWKQVTLLNCDPAKLPDVPEVHLLSPRQIPINSAKLKDIKKQLKHIPTQYQGLYLGLIAQGTDDQNSELPCIELSTEGVPVS